MLHVGEADNDARFSFDNSTRQEGDEVRMSRIARIGDVGLELRLGRKCRQDRVWVVRLLQSVSKPCPSQRGKA